MEDLKNMFVPYAKLEFEDVPLTRTVCDNHRLLQITTHSEGPVLYMVLQGEVSIETLEVLEKLIGERYIDSRCTDVVADMSKVTYIDAAGISVFVGAVATLRRRVGIVHLVDCSITVQRLITITHLTRLFRMHETRHAARTSLHAPVRYGERKASARTQERPLASSFSRIGNAPRYK